MCLMATMCRPLRSKRAMISPVRPRANASGLTRMRVRSTGSPSVQGSEFAGLDGRLFGLRASPPARRAPRRGPSGPPALAVRADRPRRVERLAARHARILELAHAVRAAQEVAIDLVGGGGGGEGGQRVKAG